MKATLMSALRQVFVDDRIRKYEKSVAGMKTGGAGMKTTDLKESARRRVR